MFNAKRVKDECVSWIRNWFALNGNGCNAVVGISGGKDSSVVAALCVEALGKDRVIGVLMPNGEQADIEDAYKLVMHLGLPHWRVINIENSVKAITFSLGIVPSEQTEINLPARVRMATLYAYSQSNNGRVANTCNKSEDYVGYSTKYGDSAGDFAPLAGLLVREVIAIGDELGLPYELVHKTPSDGLCGKTDEDNLGFTYEMLDTYISGEGAEVPPVEIQKKIDRLHNANLFKLETIPVFVPSVDYDYFWDIK